MLMGTGPSWSWRSGRLRPSCLSVSGSEDEVVEEVLEHPFPWVAQWVSGIQDCERSSESEPYREDPCRYGRSLIGRMKGQRSSSAGLD